MQVFKTWVYFVDSEMTPELLRWGVWWSTHSFKMKSWNHQGIELIRKNLEWDAKLCVRNEGRRSWLIKDIKEGAKAPMVLGVEWRWTASCWKMLKMSFKSLDAGKSQDSRKVSDPIAQRREPRFWHKEDNCSMYFYLEIKFNLIMALYSGTK